MTVARQIKTEINGRSKRKVAASPRARPVTDQNINGGDSFAQFSKSFGGRLSASWTGAGNCHGLAQLDEFAGGEGVLPGVLLTVRRHRAAQHLWVCSHQRPGRFADRGLQVGEARVLLRQRYMFLAR